MFTMVDMKQLKDSVENLSEIVDRMSERINRIIPNSDNKMKDESQESICTFAASRFCGSHPSQNIRKGSDVRFSQSQEDILQSVSMKSSLKPHLSLPNLKKLEPLSWTVNNRKSSLKNTDSIIQEDRNEDDTRIVNIPIYTLESLVMTTTRRRPRFDGSDEEHPIDFLEELQEYITELNVAEEKQVSFAISCLESKPLKWGRCFKKDFKNSFGEFSKCFKDEYWGFDQQKSAICELKLGKYDNKHSEESMSEYFLRCISRYRHLEPTPTDLEIVYSMAAHFPQTVELEMRLMHNPTLREAYKLLCGKDGAAGEFVPNYLYEMCEEYRRGRFKAVSDPRGGN